MVEDGAFSHEIDYASNFKGNLNFKGHQNCSIGSKVTAILVNGGILPRGGVALGRVCTCSLRSMLLLWVFQNLYKYVSWPKILLQVKLMVMADSLDLGHGKKVKV